MKVFVMSKPQAMMSFAFSRASRWLSSTERFFQRHFSSSVSCMTRGTLKASCRYLHQSSNDPLIDEQTNSLEFLDHQHSRNEIISENQNEKVQFFLDLNSLGKHEWDQMPQMQCLRRRTSSRVQVKLLPSLVQIKNLMEIP